MKHKKYELEAVIQEVSDSLLDWYRQHARILPWRDLPTSYRVWVSEIMLQQTRVETVLPYFDRFIKEFPDVFSLAAADEDRLLKVWQGLGYYSRVRNLQKAARIVAEKYSGRLPKDLALLKQLPGIGEYASGAIASIAYGVKAAAVDGNVLRVLSRLFGDDRDIRNPKVKRDFADRILELMPEEAAGDFSQALMELGALVCLPNGEPLCGQCPWGSWCQARAENRTGEIPVKTQAAPKKLEEKTLLLLRRGDRIAFRKRPERGLLAGLYEFPTLSGKRGEAEVREVLADMGFKVDYLKSLPDSKHVFTHRIWEMAAWEAQVEGGGEEENGMLWATAAEIRQKYSVPAAYRVVLQALT